MENTQLTIIAVILVSSQIIMAYFLYRARENQEQLRKITNYQAIEIEKIKQQIDAKKKFDRHIKETIEALRTDFNLQNHYGSDGNPLPEAILHATQGISKEQLIMRFGLDVAEADLIANGYGTKDPA